MERDRLPRPEMLGEMRKKTLDELDLLMAGLNREWAGNDQGEVAARKNDMAASAKNSVDGKDEGRSLC